MSLANSVANKMRTLVPTQDITADGALPAFPSGPDANSRVVFLGDFTGARIHGFEFACGALTTITALDCTMQHSDDGVTWHTLKALTQKTVAATTYDELDDTDPKPMRYIRALFAATGTYGDAADVSVKVAFEQCGAKGALAPPGFIERFR